MNETKEHILTISLTLFLQKNFKEVTLSDIVKSTGLSKGAFYHYFSSKEQVFEEVIQHFYADFIKEDFSAYSHNSFKEFCDDYLKAITDRMQKRRKSFGLENDILTSNHYFLVFDALKMLPSFKAESFRQNQEEIKAWKKIIKIALEKGEIKSEMKDIDIAKMFIYLNNGVGISLILQEDSTKIVGELKKQIIGLYDLLKV